MIVTLLTVAAFATPQFTATPEARFDGAETFTSDGSVKLWSAIERYADPDRSLFTAEPFNQAIRWPDQADYAPFISASFGTPTPHSSSFLLHMGLNEPIARGTPVLMVGGAGDNGSRGFITMATRLDRLQRPVYAITFAHPHGDVLRQAETVANAIAAIKARTGASHVDVVAHSKGGLAAAVYASHTSDAQWGRTDYQQVGTPYRGDIRRLVLIAAPLGGIDTAFRWSSLNLASLDADQALAPTSWDRYYPFGTIAPLVFDSLADADFLPDGRDVFPGQRQLVARQDYPLPGSLPVLQGYALQQDWFSTYEGGLGFVSRSPGIDAIIQAGGGLIARLRDRGVDPGIDVYLLAGSSPVMPNGDVTLEGQFADVANANQWRSLIADINAQVTPLAADNDEIDGLVRGKLVLGEVTGPSDGLVFVTSALDARAVDKRGARITTHIANLSHLDLLYASPVTGALLLDAADDAPGNDWMRAFGARYTAEDTLGWVQSVLADDPSDLPDTADTGLPIDERPDAINQRPCGGCDHRGGPGGLLTALLGVLVLRRRR